MPVDETKNSHFFEGRYSIQVHFLYHGTLKHHEIFPNRFFWKQNLAGKARLKQFS